MRRYIIEHIGVLVIFVVCIAVFASAFALYHLPLEAVLYPAALCAALIFCYVVAKYYRARKKHRALVCLQRLPENLCESLQKYNKQTDADYRAIIELLCEREMKNREADNKRLSEAIDYYTTWAHQIKTPIASMRLTLQNEDTPTSRRLSEDLFRIEQYVDMVMCYLRLDSDSTDYVFREHSIDNIIKGTLRKFAGQFIGRGIRLEYAGIGKTVVTDEKWLSFVIEQVLSNALKYTPSGSITISVDEPAVLCIKDTGIGIAPEDLPRIFERGYTGFTGRADKKASGLGLNLCKRICSNLGHTITAESAVGAGTTIKIDLSQDRISFE
ncbi:MAG: HAMP domain-containing histidine kinase [Clostridiales bacterium]|jgi:two-component system sensor histidine kinase BraS/BceS|nr:HAMP domain-containing histidine kinase [Clostridiales bacterium]